MKRKILVIALSLALLSSLFAFAVPAIAKNDTNDKFMEVDITIAQTGFPWPEGQNNVWLGSPATLTLPEGSPAGIPEERTIPNGGIMKWWPFISWGDITGDFGPLGILSGTYDSVAYVTYNYHNGVIRAQMSVECEFKNGEEVIGTAEFNVSCKGWMVNWQIMDPPDSDLFRFQGECVSYIYFIGGTGIFENFHFNGVGGNVFGLPIHNYEGIGHLAQSP